MAASSNSIDRSFLPLAIARGMAMNAKGQKSEYAILETNCAGPAKLKNWLRLEVIEPIPHEAIARDRKTTASGSFCKGTWKSEMIASKTTKLQRIKSVPIVGLEITNFARKLIAKSAGANHLAIR